MKRYDHAEKEDHTLDMNRQKLIEEVETNSP